MVTIRLPAALIAGIDTLAAKRELSRSEVMGEIVGEALGDNLSPPKHTARMAPLKSEPPGMERDGRGHAIPMGERLPEDRAKAKRARTKPHK